MNATASLTFRTDPEALSELEKLAEATDRTKSWHMEQALKGYLELQSWQVGQIRKGMEDAKAGRVVEHDKVEAWLETWGTENESEPPL